MIQLIWVFMSKSPIHCWKGRICQHGRIKQENYFKSQETNLTIAAWIAHCCRITSAMNPSELVFSCVINLRWASFTFYYFFCCSIEQISLLFSQWDEQNAQPHLPRKISFGRCRVKKKMKILRKYKLLAYFQKTRTCGFEYFKKV